eukprot:2372360-Prymnesium_polylepis.1
MKSVSDFLLLTASERGGRAQTEGSAQLRLEVQKDHLVSISTTYPKLDVPKMADGGDSGDGGDSADEGAVGQPMRDASARLEVKRLLK